MADAGSVLSVFADLLFGWVPRLSAVRKPNGAIGRTMPSVQTRALKRFLKCLSAREAPVLLDLGPVVGQNVAFFGEQLGCKIFVEDIGPDLETFARGDNWDEFSTFLTKRFDRPSESIDGILCWDLFDHLEKRAAKALASELARLLKPDGALLAYFATTREPSPGYAKFVVVDDTTLEPRPYAAAHGDRQVLQSRDLDRLFDGLKVSDSFLLLNRTRESLFRKRAPLARTVSGTQPVHEPRAMVEPARPTVVRPVPAAASLNVAIGRASAGLPRMSRRAAPSHGHGTNGNGAIGNGANGKGNGNGNGPTIPSHARELPRGAAVTATGRRRKARPSATKVTKKAKAPAKPRPAKAAAKPRRRQPAPSASVSEA